jgi:ABC-2 type transport system permease protein
MLRSVLTKTLRDAQRGFVWWSLGLVALMLISVAFWPSVRDNEGFKQFERDAPEALKAFTGGQLDFTSPAGYLDARLFALVVPLLFLVYAVGWGARGVAGEEEAGTLELVLALPVSRSRLLLEKLGALTLQLATLGGVLLVTVVVSAKAVSMDISSERIADAVLAVYLLGLLYGTLALAVGAATGRTSHRDRRGGGLRGRCVLPGRARPGRRRARPLAHPLTVRLGRGSAQRERASAQA